MVVAEMGEQKFLKNTFFQKYLARVKRQFMSLHNLSEISEKREKTILQWCIRHFNEFNGHPQMLLTNLQDEDGIFYSLERPLTTIFNALHREDPLKRIIITGNGTIFDPSAESQTDGLIFGLQNGRKQAKNTMYTFNRGSDDYVLYDTKQKVLKVLANSWYGANSQGGFVFFTPWSGSAVTLTSQNLVMHAAMTLEAFLSDNIPFVEEQSVFNFLDYIENQECNYDILELIDSEFHNVSAKDVIDRLILKCEFEVSASFREILKIKVSGYSLEMLLRIRYKNNMMDFFSHSPSTANIIEKCLDDEFIDPMEPTENNKLFLEELYARCREIVAYIYIQPNVGRFFHSIKRKSILVVDTDSTFVYLNPQFLWTIDRFNLDKEKSLETRGRIKICNIFTNVCSNFIRDCMARLTENAGVRPEMRHIIDMKSEFLFQRLLLTDAKKSYAGSMILNEGKIMEIPEFEIKGLPIKKVGTPKPIRNHFQKLLKERILEVPRIDVFEIIGNFVDYGEKISKSLKNNESQFLKPAKFTSQSSYVNPYSQQSFLGVIVWNAVYPDEPINDFETIYIAKIKDPFFYESEGFMTEYPDIAECIKALVDNDESLSEKGKGLSSVAVPKHHPDFPEWVLAILDVETVVIDNLQAPSNLLNSLNIQPIQFNSKQYVSNVISL